MIERQLHAIRRRHSDVILQLNEQHRRDLDELAKQLVPEQGERSQRVQELLRGNRALRAERDRAIAMRDSLQRQFDEAIRQRDAAQQELAKVQALLPDVQRLSGRLSVRNPMYYSFTGVSDVQRGQTPSEEHPVPPTDGIWLTEEELTNVIKRVFAPDGQAATSANEIAANAVRQYHERNPAEWWRAKPGQTMNWEEVALARGREITRLRRELSEWQGTVRALEHKLETARPTDRFNVYARWIPKQFGQAGHWVVRIYSVHAEKTETYSSDVLLLTVRTDGLVSRVTPTKLHADGTTSM
jgi:hypothetical protein